MKDKTTPVELSTQSFTSSDLDLTIQIYAYLVTNKHVENYIAHTVALYLVEMKKYNECKIRDLDAVDMVNTFWDKVDRYYTHQDACILSNAIQTVIAEAQTMMRFRRSFGVFEIGF